MKNSIVKKILMTALTGTLVLSSAATAYAAPTGGGRGGRMEQGQNETTESERPELSKDASDGERPEPPEGLQDGEKPEPPTDMANGERPEAPENLQDGEKPELPEDMSDGSRPDGQKELPEGAVNIMAYKDALKNVEDEETVSSLQSYLDKLKEALDAERSALDSETELSDDEKASYRNAVTEAENALKTAYEEAGIEVSDELPAGAAGNRPQKKNDDCDQAATRSGKKNQGTDSKAASDSGTDDASSDTSDSDSTKRSFKAGWQKLKSQIQDLFI